MKSASWELKTLRYWLLLGLILLAINPSMASGDKPAVQGNSTQRKRQIKTIIVADYYPYTFINKEGVPGGFSVELAKAATAVMGMDLEIKADTWDQARRRLETGDIDFLPMMAYSEERDKAFDFSAPHTIAYDAFFTRKDGKRLNTLEDLKGRTVIVMKDDQAHDYLRSSDLVDSKHLILIESLPEALRLLSSGKGDAALMPKLVGLTIMNDLNLANLTPSPIVIESYNRPFSFAVKEGNQLLLERLSQGLSIVKKTGQYREIHDKWFGALEPLELSLKSVLKYIVGLFLALLLIGSLFALWSFSLRKLVASRTKKLADEMAERKQAEMRFRQIAETIREVFWLGSLDWKEIYYISPAYEQVWGRKCAELYHSPMSWFESVVEEDRQKVREALLKATADAHETACPDYRIRKPDGSMAWISARVFPVLDDSGRPCRLAGIAEDITERKQAERQLALVNFALNHVREAAFLTDEHARFHYVNEDTSRVLGYTCAELLELGVQDVDPDFPPERWINHWNDLKARRSLTFDGRHRAKDGRIFPVEINANYFEYDGQGYNLALARDITERKQAEEAQRENEAQLSMALEVSNAGIWEWNIEIDEVRFDARFHAMLGYSPGELPTTLEEWKTYHHPEDMPVMFSKTSAYLHGDSPAYESEHRIRAKAGTWNWVFTRGKLVNLTTTGSPKLFMGIAMNVTEKKRVEETLHRLNRELRAISNCNQTLLRANDEQTLLNEICRIICDEAGYRLAWAGFAEHDEAKTVRPVAWAGFDSGYIANAKISWAEDAERGRGPAGIAIRSGEIIHVQDFATDPRMAPWRESTLQHGYRSGVALPLKDEKTEVFGVLLIYSGETNAIAPDEIRLMEELSRDLAFGIMVLRTRAERKRTQEALVVNAERYRLAQVVGHVGSWEYNLQTTQFWGSDEAKRIYGFDPGQNNFSTGEVESCIPERDRVHQALIDLIEKGKAYNLEFEIHPKNSAEPRFIASIADLQRDEHGALSRVVGVIQDITLRKRTEEELRRMNERFSLAAHAARLGVWDWDIQKNELLWDDGMYALYGIGKGGFAGAYEAWLHGVHPGDRDRCDEISEQARRGEREYDTEFRVVWPDGSIHHLKAYGLVVRDADGKALRMTGVNFNITERKKAEEALRESEAKTRSILDNIGIGVALISPGMEILELNHRMREWFPAADPGRRLICYRTFKRSAPRGGLRLLPNLQDAAGWPGPRSHNANTAGRRHTKLPRRLFSRPQCAGRSHGGDRDGRRHHRKTLPGIPVAAVPEDGGGRPSGWRRSP